MYLKMIYLSEGRNSSVQKCSTPILNRFTPVIIGLQSRFGDKVLGICVVCLHHGTGACPARLNLKNSLRTLETLQALERTESCSPLQTSVCPSLCCSTTTTMRVQVKTPKLFAAQATLPPLRTSAPQNAPFSSAPSSKEKTFLAY